MDNIKTAFNGLIACVSLVLTAAFIITFLFGLFNLIWEAILIGLLGSIVFYSVANEAWVED